MTQILVRVLSFNQVISQNFANGLEAVIVTLSIFIDIFFGSALIGVTTWIVAQLLAVPLRPVSWRAAMGLVRGRWRSIAGTVTFSTMLSAITFPLCFLGFFLAVRYSLVSPVVILEKLSGRAALRRSAQLTSQAYLTSVAAILIYLMPIILGVAIIITVESTVAVTESLIEKINEEKSQKGAIEKVETSDNSESKPQGPARNPGIKIWITDESPEGDKTVISAKPLTAIITQTLSQLFLLPITIFLNSFSAVTLALLYFKTRQANGESFKELLVQLEDDRPQKRWQLRLKERLGQSGRHTKLNT
jgi:hypothetical protein